MSDRNDKPDGYDGQELDRLLSRLADELATADELAALERILLSHPAARKRYVHYLDLHEELRIRAAEGGLALPAERAADASVPSPRGILGARSIRLGIWALVASLALVAVSTAGWWIASREWRIPAVAQISNAQNCLWTAGLKPGDLLPGSTINLERGLLELHFRGGADIVLEGPVKVELLSNNIAKLLQGRLTAHVPPQARGFQVLSPHGKVIDLGTDFGMSVAASGDAEVVVFQGKVNAYSNRNVKRPLNLVTEQAARIDRDGVALKIRGANVKESEFVRAIEPPPVIVPRTLSLSFRQAVPDSLCDRVGNGTGLTHRLPGTGALLDKNDEHLQLNLKSGQLEVSTTESDLNGLYQLDQGEYLGLRLADLGFTGDEDFEITATFLKTPTLELLNQFGLYAGTDSKRNIRGGMIAQEGGHGTQFIVSHEAASDKNLVVVGVSPQNSDIVLTLRRIGGRYSLASDNRTTGASVALTTKHPTFLDAAADIHVGVFGANTRTKEPRIVTIKDLKVTVWTKTPPRKQATRT